MTVLIIKVAECLHDAHLLKINGRKKSQQNSIFRFRLSISFTRGPTCAVKEAHTQRKLSRKWLTEDNIGEVHESNKSLGYMKRPLLKESSLNTQ